MSKKQSSVEWLEIELEKLWIKKYLSPITIKPLLEQAKVMHKEQTLEFVYDAVRKILDEDRQNPFNLEQYYEQKFGGNNEQ